MNTKIKRNQFAFELKKIKTHRNFSTNEKGKFKFNLSFNDNWKLKDINSNKFMKIDNENGYLTFKASI